MKKIFTSIITLFIILSWVNICSWVEITTTSQNETNTWIVEKISKTNSKIYKDAILSRAYIRSNIKNWEEILYIIEVYFNNTRRDKNIEKLETLKFKTWELLKKFDNKKLNYEEKKVFNLIKNLYYRSIIELIKYWKINL
jgi:hypothetical protein